MKKQTAIDWFQDQILLIIEGKCELSEMEMFTKAKQIEKQQIIDAYANNGWDTDEDRADGKKYYTRIYGGKNDN